MWLVSFSLGHACLSYLHFIGIAWFQIIQALLSNYFTSSTPLSLSLPLSQHVITLDTEESNYRAGNIRSKARHIWEAIFEKRESSETLETMLAVWGEMLVYAAEHCSRDSHARNLTDNGGEFITVLWLMIKHDMCRPGLVSAKAPNVFKLQVPFPLADEPEGRARKWCFL